MRSIRVLWALLCVMCVSVSAAAQPPADANSARAFEAYGRGQRLFREQDYVGAQAAFEEAYRAVPNPVALLSVAEAQQRQNHGADAIETLNRYLAQTPNAPNRTKVEGEIAKIRATLPAKDPAPAVSAPSALTVAHRSKLPSSYRLVKAVFEVDGAPILTRTDEKNGLGDPQGWSTTHVTLTPGKHTVEVQLDYKDAAAVPSRGQSYRYSLRSYLTVSPAAGNNILLTVVAYERPGPSTSFGDRLKVKFDEQVSRVAGLEQSSPQLARSTK